MNEITKALFEKNTLPELNDIKICTFQYGEIIVKNVLEMGVGTDEYKDFFIKKNLKQEEPDLEIDFEIRRGDSHSINLSYSDLQVEEFLQNNFKNQVLILVSTQLGLSEVAPTYYPSLASLFKIKSFTGAVGGRPNKAYYFVGLNDIQDRERLIYLDPHFVQNKVYNLNNEYKDVAPSKFHCDQPRVLEMKELDPSISFGFLVSSYSEFQSFVREIEKINLVANGDKVITFV